MTDRLKMLDILNINIHKSTVLKKDYTKLKKILDKLEKSKTDSKYKLIISFDGYDLDTAEIYEIKEIRDYVWGLFNKYPHIFYFLSPLGEYNKFILACITDIETLFIGEKLNPIEAMFRGIELPPIRMKFNIKPDIEMKIRAKTREFGRRIKESKKNIDNILNEIIVGNINNLFIPNGGNGKKIHISVAYHGAGIEIWNKTIKELSKNIKYFNNIMEVDFAINKFMPIIQEIKNYGALTAPLMVEKNGQMQLTNLFYVQDSTYGAICENCGSDHVIVIKNKLDTHTSDEDLIFIPAMDNYTMHKIAPYTHEFKLQYPIPILDKDKWYCPYCREIHEFHNDLKYGIIY